MLFVDRIVQLAFYLAYRLHLLWNFFLRSECHGVWVAVWSNGQLLIIKNSYRSSFTLPGGSIDGAEVPVQAALRELREEVGIEAQPEELVFWGQYLSRAEYKHDHINVFELELSTPPRFKVDNREVHWGAMRLPEQALELNLFPALRSYLQDKRMGRPPGVSAEAL